MMWWLLLAAVAGSVVLTGMLRRYALARSLVDVPNARSSHSVPTPRGGGVAIVVIFLTALPMLAWLGMLSPAALTGLWGAGALVAFIGFLDDHGHIAARWRLLVHFAAASWGLYWLGGLPPMELLGFQLDLAWGGHALAAVYIVWLLNLYNFMDGIDGIAGIEAITVSLGGALLAWSAGHLEPVAPALVLALAVVGFLYWNFPPARIFMGDAGSGFLGVTLALLSILGAQGRSETFWSWVILLGVFIVDATVTLLRRVKRGEKFYEAHRSHAYQYASRKIGAHRPVSLAVGAINLLWLLPLAVLVTSRRLDGVAGVTIAYVPLVWLAFRYKAGAREMQEL